MGKREILVTSIFSFSYEVFRVFFFFFVFPSRENQRLFHKGLIIKCIYFSLNIAMPPSGNKLPNDVCLNIGILEVQGAFLEHRVALEKANEMMKANTDLKIHEVRSPEHISSDLDGLIIPGGESTAISLYLKRNNMVEPLKEWVKDEDHVTWGTCAGMILLAKMTENQKIGGQPTVRISTIVFRLLSLSLPLSLSQS